ncbi:hypothetical protein LTR84_000933 [Exophiala bonariae]|uniref:Zn(2)-C6 fungal-type domain-containing protein n=1 Tax=Exophiala bonariae TaxID=1690606 RepID=A0AAV9NSA1_9EURO|nr:hypothetical protein LTR84_000933 [Exophiala bonariae]
MRSQVQKSTGRRGNSALTDHQDQAPGRSELSTNDEPESKRRRVALACNVCRGRKSRCDGKRPSCSLCIELGFECQYQQGAGFQNVIIGKDYLSSIESRLRLVEGRLSRLEGGTEDTSRAVTPLEASSNPRKQTQTQSEIASLQREELEATEVAEDSIDAMGVVTFAQEEDCAFFGPSSNIALLRQVSAAIAHLSHESQPWRPSPTEGNSVADIAGSFLNTTRPSSPARASSETTRGKPNVFAIPSGENCRKLLNWFFGNPNYMYPYIHVSSFMRTFEAAEKNKFKGVRRIWLALLNIIFALARVHARQSTVASKDHPSVELGPIAESQVYYQRASALFNENMIGNTGTSIEVVQFLLLIGSYLQSTQKSTQTWKMHGLAVRAAFQLGLHSRDLGRLFSPTEQEVRKRSWFGCIINETLLSMTYGRPPSIPENYMQLDLPVAFAALEGEQDGSEADESLSISFFTGTITIYKVLQEIIDTLYGQNLACSLPTNDVDTVSKVYQIENRLSLWQQQLPTEMRLVDAREIFAQDLPIADGSAENHWRQLRLRFVLTLRYINIRILLHRPVMVKFLEELRHTSTASHLPLLLQIGTANVQIAAKSSMELIYLVKNALRYANGRSQWGLLGAWWYSLYYTFNAALVIGACILIQVEQKGLVAQASIRFSESTEQMSEHLGMAIEVLRDLDEDNRMVARCRDYLEQFVQIIRSLAIGHELLPQPTDWRMPDPPNTGAPELLPYYDDYHLLQTSILGGANVAGQNNHSPFGMEMGQFLLDSDLNVLNYNSFAYSRATAPHD